MEEYKRHPILAYILHVETLEPEALLYRRVGDMWEIESFDGIDAVIALPAIGAELALADFYERLTFPSRRDLTGEMPVD